MSRNVSSRYKQLMAGLQLPATLFKITFGIESVGASSDATVTTENTETEFSDIETITDGYLPTKNYMVQEWNTFPLDQTKTVLDRTDIQQNQFCPDILSNNVATFSSTTPAFQIVFSEPRDMLGLTFIFDPLSFTYGSSVTVKGYNNDTLISTETTYPESYTHVTGSLNGVDKITIEIGGTNLPYARVRLAQLYFGIIDIHTQQDTTEVTQEFKISPINNELYSATVTYKMDNFDKVYDIDNPQGIYEYITDQQPLKIEYSMDGTEWITAGNLLTDGQAKIENNLTEIKGIDKIQFMNDTYYKDVYRSTAISLYDLAMNVLGDFGWELNEVGEYPYDLDEGLQDIYTLGTLPVAKHSECLQMIAFAANMGFWVDDRGYICIKPLPDTVVDTDYYVDFGLSATPPTPEKIEPLAQIDMTVHNYKAKGSDELYEAEFNFVGTQTIQVDYDLSKSQSASVTTRGTIDSAVYYGRYAEITVTATGKFTLTITGNVIKDNTSTYSKEYSNKGEVAPYDNPLITDEEMAENCATYIGNYLNCRIRYKVEWVEDYRINVGDLIRIKSNFTENLIGRVIRIKTSEPKLLGELEVVIVGTYSNNG